MSPNTLSTEKPTFPRSGSGLRLIYKQLRRIRRVDDRQAERRRLRRPPVGGPTDWNSAGNHTPDELFTMWTDAVERSRALVAQALDGGGLSVKANRTWPDGNAPSLRWILLHMIEEYARHNGHADLLREAVDGQTGE